MAWLHDTHMPHRQVGDWDGWQSWSKRQSKCAKSWRFPHRRTRRASWSVAWPKSKRRRSRSLSPTGNSSRPSPKQRALMPWTGTSFRLRRLIHEHTPTCARAHTRTQTKRLSRALVHACAYQVVLCMYKLSYARLYEHVLIGLPRCDCCCVWCVKRDLEMELFSNKRDILTRVTCDTKGGHGEAAIPGAAGCARGREEQEQVRLVHSLSLTLSPPLHFLCPHCTLHPP